MAELVSIVVPIYNMEDTLYESVKSLLKQDYEDIEVILVDDGSTDNTYEVCKTLERLDEKIKCVHTENMGSGPARNTGIQNSNGKYLYFPDADDYLEPNAISILVNAVEEGNYDLVVFGYQCKNQEGEIISQKEFKSFSNTGNRIRASYEQYFDMTKEFSIQGAPWNKFFDAELIKKNNIEFPSLRRHQDEGFISRYMSYCNCVKFIPDILYCYHVNTAGLEWRKYPIDYIDSVLGLGKVWQETICTWNKDDTITRELVKRRIFSNTLKALELSFSPKMELNIRTRKKWLASACKKTNLLKYQFDVTGSLYQRLVLLSIKMHSYTILQLLLYMGVQRTRFRQGK